MRLFFTLSLFFGLFSPLFGQNIAPNFWTPVKPESISLPPAAERKITPAQLHTFQLDYASLKTALLQAPMEFTPAARQQPVLLNLPLADGSLHTFRVLESPVMAPELMAKFPAIRTYAGSADDDSGLTVRLGVDYTGFYAYIFSQESGTQVVRPYADGTSDFYMTYRQKDLSSEQGNRFHCGVNDNEVSLNPSKSEQAATERGAAPVILRKYRLAVVTQGEYAQFHGGTKQLVMSAITQAVNYIVKIQERDWAVRLELIPNNDTLVYLDPATDPYTGGGLIPDWIGDNPGAINPLVGINNYDIGHLFSRVNNPTGIYVAGQAGGVTCDQFSKAVAGSSLPEPIGEDFYLIIAHEMGHQFSASHTFNSCPSSAGQTSGQTAYEPGGGSTIMGYTVCDTDNIPGGRDDYFHVGNIEQVVNFLTLGSGSTCGEAIVTGNNAPEVSIPLTDDFYIPISTPFTLNGNATDQDGDDLTYCWEEFDLGPTSSLGNPTGDAPIFRSYPPADSPSRTFPRINNIVFNTLNNTEVLPTYSRNLTFKLTVRDNHPGVGGVTSAQVKFKATDKAGPFVVTYPNSSSVTWYVGEYQTVEWDVTNTDKDPVNCQKVDILLSTNNGLGYQVVLASGVPNTGRYCIQVPNNTSSNARIRVQATENVFFDISNAGFKLLQPPAPDFSFCAGPVARLTCAPATATAEISTKATSGFSEPITLSATGLPTGVTAAFSPNPVAPGGTSTVTINFNNQVPEGPFTLLVEGAAASSTTRSFGLPFEVVQNDFSTMALQSPVFGAQSVDLAPWLSWNGAASADNYGIQVATNPSFEQSVLLYSTDNLTLDSFKIPALLPEGQVIYWRVRPLNECGPGPWLEPFVFVTKIQSCATFVATDLPKNISATGTPTVESKITVTGGGASLSDVNVKKVQGNHDFMKDLEVRLISPAGTNILLFKDKCGSYSGNFNIGFDDSGNGTFSCPPPQNGTFAKPAEPLSVLNGQDANGVWTLRVKDNEFSSGGQLAGFEIQLCSSVGINAPFIVNNNLLELPGGTNAVVGENLLKAEDPNNGPGQLVFTLVSVPRNGILSITGGPMQPGAQFTQDDINNGLLRYYDYGWNLGTDDFRFTVTDGEGGLVTGTFNIQPSTVGTKEPSASIAFGLAPNPASESVRLFVTQALDTDSRVILFNTAGQQLRSWMLNAGSTMLLLDIANLPQGVYAVAVENEKGRGVKKVVIKE